MTGFTTRVELHHSHTSEDYEKLHKAMEKEGFTRTIAVGKEAVVCQLPTAEYNRYSDSLTASEVLASAKKAASTVSKYEPSILVTKSDGNRATSGLKPVKK